MSDSFVTSPKRSITAFSDTILLIAFRYCNSIIRAEEIEELIEWTCFTTTKKTEGGKKILFTCSPPKNGISSIRIFRVEGAWLLFSSPFVINNTTFLCAKISWFSGRQFVIWTFGGKLKFVVSASNLHKTFCFNCPNAFKNTSSLVFSSSLCFAWLPKSTKTTPVVALSKNACEKKLRKKTRLKS